MNKLSSLKRYIHLANRIAAKPDADEDLESVEDVEDVDTTEGNTEYACRIELNIDAVFEGSEVSVADLRAELKKNIKDGLTAAIKAVTSTLQMSKAEVHVKPITFEVALSDESDDIEELVSAYEQMPEPESLESEDELEGTEDEEESDEEESDEEESDEDESDEEESDEEESDEEESDEDDSDEEEPEDTEEDEED